MKTVWRDGMTPGKEEIDIPSLDSDEDGFVKVSTMDDFLLLIQSMGWDDIAGFERSTGVIPEELLNKWWLTMHDRVMLRD